MAIRKRDHIPLSERLAATLACLLPQETRDQLRHAEKPVSAETVIRLFTFDHLHLHCLGGTDHWSNLDPRLRGQELKAKDRRDTSIAAKSKRISKEAEKWVSGANPKKWQKPKFHRAWPSRPLQSRSTFR